MKTTTTNNDEQRRGPAPRTPRNAKRTPNAKTCNRDRERRAGRREDRGQSSDEQSRTATHSSSSQRQPDSQDEEMKRMQNVMAESCGCAVQRREEREDQRRKTARPRPNRTNNQMTCTKHRFFGHFMTKNLSYANANASETVFLDTRSCSGLPPTRGKGEANKRTRQRGLCCAVL